MAAPHADRPRPEARRPPRGHRPRRGGERRALAARERPALRGRAARARRHVPRAGGGGAGGARGAGGGAEGASARGQGRAQAQPDRPHQGRSARGPSSGSRGQGRGEGGGRGGEGEGEGEGGVLDRLGLFKGLRAGRALQERVREDQARGAVQGGNAAEPRPVRLESGGRDGCARRGRARAAHALDGPLALLQRAAAAQREGFGGAVGHGQWRRNRAGEAVEAAHLGRRAQREGGEVRASEAARGGVEVIPIACPQARSQAPHVQAASRPGSGRGPGRRGDHGEAGADARGGGADEPLRRGE
mmetsp:Transcript_8912/g.20818  ORF Transcript_8912/g.20818 Transcript_8912/m.20818 type:complete len:302 (+) Transcript_8912:183-1088(+)